MILVDPAKRPDFILKKFADDHGQRIVALALRFLALHPQGAAFSSIGIGCYHCYSLWAQPSKERRLKEAACLVSSATFGYFLPSQQLLLSSGVVFTKHIRQLITKDATWQERGTTVCRILHQIIHLLSTYQKTPLWRFLSLASQAVDELIQAYQHYNKGEKPEVVASLYLAWLRVDSTSIYMEELFRPQGKKIPFWELLEEDNAFYKQPDYLKSTGRALSQHEPMPITYRCDSEGQELYPVGIPPFIHTLLGKWFFLPASNPQTMNRADNSRKKIPVTDEWRHKRITIGSGIHRVDAMIVGKRETLSNGTWVLASNGNDEVYEDKMSRSSEFKGILSEIGANGIVFNYPGVGSSSGSPNRYAMTKAYQAVLSFLEDEQSGVGAKKIVGYGHSIGGGAQGDALETHQLKNTIQYVFVKSRTFSDLSTISSAFTNGFIGFFVKMLGWNLDSVTSSKKLKTPEIILTTARVPSYQVLTDSSKIINDGVIHAKASLAKRLLDDPSCPRANKVFVGILDRHNERLSDIPYLGKLIQSFWKKPELSPSG